MICQDYNKSVLAMEMFKNIRKVWHTSLELTKACPNPCEFLRISLHSEPKKLRFSQLPYTSFKFEKYIQVTESSVSYKALELLAEVGGYVGLFLGISIVHIGEIFDTLLKVKLS